MPNPAEIAAKPDWYPRMKTRPAHDCPRYVDLDIWESSQMQEAWAVEGSVGPEMLAWIDGEFSFWMPAITIERAISYARSRTPGASR
jgi:hypothetical protein